MTIELFIGSRRDRTIVSRRNDHDDKMADEILSVRLDERCIPQKHKTARSPFRAK